MLKICYGFYISECIEFSIVFSMDLFMVFRLGIPFIIVLNIIFLFINFFFKLLKLFDSRICIFNLFIKGTFFSILKGTLIFFLFNSIKIGFLFF